MAEESTAVSRNTGFLNLGQMDLLFILGAMVLVIKWVSKPLQEIPDYLLLCSLKIVKLFYLRFSVVPTFFTLNTSEIGHSDFWQYV